jgi:hypothetical protein
VVVTGIAKRAQNRLRDSDSAARDGKSAHSSVEPLHSGGASSNAFQVEDLMNDVPLGLF